MSQDTKQRILETACTLFAERGFDGVTNRDLADEAGVNSALINYHFGSKRELFEAALKHSLELTEAKYSSDSSKDISPLAAIEALVRARLTAVFDNGPAGWFPRLIHHELHRVDGNREQVSRTYLRPRNQVLTHLVSAFLERPADDLLVRTTAFNLKSHWIMLNISRSRGKGFFEDKGLKENEVQTVIDEITDYIIGGLRHVKQNDGYRNIQ